MPDEDVGAATTGRPSGDPDAFERWVAGSEHPLRASLRSFATRVDVEAVVQEALLRAWNIAPRIVRNLAIDEVRRARSVAIGDDELDASLTFATFEAMPDPLLREAIHRSASSCRPNRGRR